jgi:hypothetical protein
MLSQILLLVLYITVQSFGQKLEDDYLVIRDIMIKQLPSSSLSDMGVEFTFGYLHGEENCICSSRSKPNSTEWALNVVGPYHSCDYSKDTAGHLTELEDWRKTHTRWRLFDFEGVPVLQTTKDTQVPFKELPDVYRWKVTLELVVGSMAAVYVLSIVFKTESLLTFSESSRPSGIDVSVKATNFTIRWPTWIHGCSKFDGGGGGFVCHLPSLTPAVCGPNVTECYYLPFEGWPPVVQLTEQQWQSAYPTDRIA